MKKNNKEKTKKIAVAVCLITTGVLAIVGISFTLRSEEPAITLADERDVTAAVNTDSEVAVPAITPSVSPSAAPTTEPEVVISLDVNCDVEDEGAVQSIQLDPIKTEDEKPSEPPADAQDADSKDKGNPPENTQIHAEAASKDTANDHPQNGTVRDGKIYIEGFGWVDYEGGGTNGIQANEIYENGNTIGIMD